MTLAQVSIVAAYVYGFARLTAAAYLVVLWRKEQQRFYLLFAGYFFVMSVAIVLSAMHDPTAMDINRLLVPPITTLLGLWAVRGLSRFVKDHSPRTDKLTGLLTRNAGQIMLDNELMRSRQQKRRMTVVMFDVNKFKGINDTYGHGVGDEVLTAVCNVLLSVFRLRDMVIRWGGDEFLAVMPDTTEPQANAVVQRVMLGIDALRFTEVGFGVSLSFGVQETSLSPSAGLLSLAEGKLYQFKSARPN